MNDATHSLSFKSFFHEIRQEFGSPDRGFLLTAWKMCTAPGPTLREVFRGEGAELTRPVRYFLMVFTFYGLVYISTGAIGITAADTSRHMAEWINQAHAVRGIAARITPSEIAKANPFTYYLQYPLVFEIIVTILLWAASWPALARMGLNATERLGATMYIYGTFNLLQIPLVVFVFMGRSSTLDVVLGLLFMAYLAWATHGLAAPPNRLAFLRGIGWYVILQLLSGIVIGLPLLMMVRDVDDHPAQHVAAPASTASS